MAESVPDPPSNIPIINGLIGNSNFPLTNSFFEVTLNANATTTFIPSDENLGDVTLINGFGSSGTTVGVEVIIDWTPESFPLVPGVFPGKYTLDGNLTGPGSIEYDYNLLILNAEVSLVNPGSGSDYIFEVIDPSTPGLDSVTRIPGPGPSGISFNPTTNNVFVEDTTPTGIHPMTLEVVINGFTKNITIPIEVININDLPPPIIDPSPVLVFDHIGHPGYPGATEFSRDVVWADNIAPDAFLGPASTPLPGFSDVYSLVPAIRDMMGMPLSTTEPITIFAEGTSSGYFSGGQYDVFSSVDYRPRGRGLIPVAGIVLNTTVIDLNVEPSFSTIQIINPGDPGFSTGSNLGTITLASAPAGFDYDDSTRTLTTNNVGQVTGDIFITWSVQPSGFPSPVLFDVPIGYFDGGPFIGGPFVGGRYSGESCSIKNGNCNTATITGNASERIPLLNDLVELIGHIIRNRVDSDYTTPEVTSLNQDNVFYNESVPTNHTLALTDTIDFFVGTETGIIEAGIKKIVNNYFLQFRRFVRKFYNYTPSTTACKTGETPGFESCVKDCNSSVTLKFGHTLEKMPHPFQQPGQPPWEYAGTGGFVPPFIGDP